MEIVGWSSLRFLCGFLVNNFLDNFEIIFERKIRWVFLKIFTGSFWWKSRISRHKKTKSFGSGPKFCIKTGLKNLEVFWYTLQMKIAWGSITICLRIFHSLQFTWNSQSYQVLLRLRPWAKRKDDLGTQESATKI